MTCPTEHVEQCALIRWANAQACAVPELGLLLAIPNGGDRHVAVAAKLRSEGVRAGVPDLLLPVPRGGSHGLWIEMKRRQGGRTSPEQREWIARLSGQGYATAVCRGWDDARETISRYLKMEAA